MPKVYLWPFFPERRVFAKGSFGDFQHVIYVVLAVSAALAAVAIVEYWSHKRRLKAIPIRILVNGTRGKSTVTRLIAAGLATGGLRTYAKTTGSAALLIRPDLQEEPIRRRGAAKRRASIMEHRWFVREAYNDRAQAIVAECMAIRPETIRTLETRLSHSTIGVITNVRLDHMDTMGTELVSVAEVLAESVPEKGRCFVGSEGMDESVESVFAQKATRREAELCLVGSDEETRLLCGEFSYPVFAQNLALALAVCGACGVPRELALRGMHGVAPDPGVRPPLEFMWCGITIRLVNAFAANDVQSTLEMWHSGEDSTDASCARPDASHTAPCLPDCSGKPDVVREARRFRALVFNHREDRAWRAFQLGEIAMGMGADAILVYCLNERLARRTVRGYYRKSGLQREEIGALSIPVIHAMQSTDAGSLLETIRNLAGFDAAGPARIDILCAGNIKGPGLALTESFAAMSLCGAEKIFLGGA